MNKSQDIHTRSEEPNNGSIDNDMTLNAGNDMVVEEQVKLISEGSVQLISKEELSEKLKTGEPLTVKLGCDPSRPDLHLGHMVVLKKARLLQDLGHRVVLIVGDFTATIGDPTDKSATRTQMTMEETREFGKSYTEQALKVLDPSPEKLEVKHNSEWMSDMDLGKVISLASNYTVARMLERDDFHKRYSNEEPIHIHEFLYPLLQAYDSVHIGADIEIGGTDQTFNLLVGRDIQTRNQQSKQVVLTMPLLVGLDGKEKMSKSLDNYIGLSDPPERMYEKIMKVPDTLLLSYFELLSNSKVGAEDIASDPLEMHHKLAGELVEYLHGEEFVAPARSRYQSVAAGGSPEKITEVQIASSELNDGQITIPTLAVLTGLCNSKSEARRLIQGRGMRIDGEVINDPDLSTSLESSIVLQRGKNKFIRIRKEQ